MKKAQLTYAAALICVIVLNLCNLCFAQTPQSFKYQAVARDLSGNVLANQAIGFQISILQGSATGASVYTETHAATTNGFGLVNLEIGSGTIISGDFTTINWGNDIYFTKIEMDETGGTNYLLMGTSQLLSVPYALHAKTAGTITESDPVFGSSVAGGITAADTTNWNNHTVDTDTQIDSAGIAAFGFVTSGSIQIDSAGIANLGYVAGTHTIDTQIDSAGITTLGFVAGAHTVDTDTQLDSAGIAALGFVTSGTTQIDSTGIANLGYIAGAHTVNTDTQLDSTGVVSLGFVAGAHTIDTDTQLDSAGIAALGYAAGAHTIDTDTQLDSTGVSALGYVAGAHTTDTDTQIDSTGVAALGYVAGAHTVDTDTQLDSTGIAALGYVAGADADSTNELQNFFASLTGDTLYLSNGNYVIIPGVSAANPPPFPCGTDSVQDADGNWYQTVLIGTQCWLKENMRTTKYPDGSAITKGDPAQGSGSWTVDIGLYSCPPNTANNAEDCAVAASLGMLYQWSAAMDGSTTAGTQGICPAGWHVPTDIEWCTLENLIEAGTDPSCNTTGWRGTSTGSKMANHVADQSWTANTLTGDAGFGSSGFDVGPSGFRFTNGNYYDRATYTYLWSSIESGTDAWLRTLNYADAPVNRGTVNKAGGFSVRCLKD